MTPPFEPCRARTGLLVACVIAAGILGAGSSTARAQSASIRGIILAGGTGQPLAGANVAVLRSDSLVRGTATDRNGSFLVGGLAPGTYVLEISFVGYRASRDTIGLDRGENRVIEVGLTPVAEEMGEVLVEAEDRAGAAQVQAGYQRLEAEDLARIPTPGLSPDLASYVSSQPGVVSLGDRGGGFYIRGGEPSQNRIYVDRIPIYHPFHMIGFYSAVPSTIVQQTDLYAGGYPSSYSGGLSSVIDVGTRTGHMREYRGSASISPFIGSVSAEGPIRPGRVSFLGSYRHSTLGTGASRYVDQPLPFSFSDGFLKLHGRIAPTKRVTGSVIRSSDSGVLGSAPRDSTAQEVNWVNSGGSIRYLFLPSAIPMQGELFLSYARLGSELGPPDDPVRDSQLENFRVGAHGTFPGDQFSFDAGFTTEFVDLRTRLGSFYRDAQAGAVVSLTQTGLFVTSRIAFLPGDQLTLEPGLRAHFYNVRLDPYVEPRVRFSFRRAGHELSFSGGVFHQELLGLTDRRDAASVFTAWTAIPSHNVGFSQGIQNVLYDRLGRAYHLAGSYRVRPLPGIEVAAEGFYRHYSNLFVQEWTSLVSFSPRLQPAVGRSYGGSVRLEAEGGPFYGFVNYGYSNTRYAAENTMYELWYGRDRLDFRPPHDQRHQVNAVVELSGWGFTLNARWTAATGRPFSRPVGFDGYVFMENFESQFESDSERRVIYEEPFNAVLPMYHRLDVSVERDFQLGRRADLTVQASVINAYDRANVFYLDLYTQERRDQLPFVPSLGLELSIGG